MRYVVVLILLLANASALRAEELCPGAYIAGSARDGIRHIVAKTVETPLMRRTLTIGVIYVGADWRHVCARIRKEVGPLIEQADLADEEQLKALKREVRNQIGKIIPGSQYNTDGLDFYVKDDLTPLGEREAAIASSVAHLGKSGLGSEALACAEKALRQGETLDQIFRTGCRGK